MNTYMGFVSVNTVGNITEHTLIPDLKGEKREIPYMFSTDCIRNK